MAKAADDMQPPQTWINRRGSKRTVPMEVMALGFARTGTLSMRVALKKLGYNECYHTWAWMENPLDGVLWQEAVDAKWKGKGKPYGREEFDWLLGHCRALCDEPCIAFAPELIAAYPDAKIVLVERDVDSWYRSAADSIFASAQETLMIRLSPLDRFMRNWFPVICDVLKHHFRGALQLSDPKQQEALVKQVYKEHYEMVKRLVPKERLLVMRMEEGWEPLCRFLGKEVPKGEAFPRVNEGETFAKQWKGLHVLLYMRAAQAAAMGLGAVGAVWLAWWFARRRAWLSS